MAMRPLTQDEVAAMHPTPQDGTPVYVYGYPPGSPGGGGGGGGGGSGNGGDPGGNGSSKGPATAGHTHETPGENFYQVKTDLTASQTRALDRIIDYGTAHNYDNNTILNIANQAFHESRLGDNEGPNSPSGVVGMFQYDAGTWADNYSNLNRFSDTDQINAMYQEATKFSEGRWSAGQAAGTIPQSLSYDDYAEYKHHGYYGDGGTGPGGGGTGANWTAYEDTYNRDESILGIGKLNGG